MRITCAQSEADSDDSDFNDGKVRAPASFLVLFDVRRLASVDRGCLRALKRLPLIRAVALPCYFSGR